MANIVMARVRKANTVAAKTNLWEIGMLKLSVAAFALFIAKLLPSLLAFDAWIYLAVSLIVGLPLMLRGLARYLG